jgi:hypothetical protein
MDTNANIGSTTNTARRSYLDAITSTDKYVDIDACSDGHKFTNGYSHTHEHADRSTTARLLCEYQLGFEERDELARNGDSNKV